MIYSRGSDRVIVAIIPLMVAIKSASVSSGMALPTVDRRDLPPGPALPAWCVVKQRLLDERRLDCARA